MPLSVAVSHGLIVHQMNVKIAFLNEGLEEEIYMNQLDSFVVNSQDWKVCKLLKSLYSLQQASKQWHKKFNKVLTSVEFIVNEVDKCVYYWFDRGEGVILCIHVDDILIFSNITNVIEEVKYLLSSDFEMKYLEEVDVILNVKLLRKGVNGRVTLVQSYYMEKVLNHFGYSDGRPSLTLYNTSMLLKKITK
jgi:hypothetical protein